MIESLISAILEHGIDNWHEAFEDRTECLRIITMSKNSKLDQVQVLLEVCDKDSYDENIILLFRQTLQELKEKLV